MDNYNDYISQQKQRETERHQRELQSIDRKKDSEKNRHNNNINRLNRQLQSHNYMQNAQKNEDLECFISQESLERIKRLNQEMSEFLGNL